MSIIQSLRDKAAWIVTVAIAFALLVFVVEEGLRNKSIFGGSSNSLGKVNGTTIDRVEFEKKFKNLEDRYANMGYNLDENTRQQERDRLWNEYVEDAILVDEYDKLGIEVTDKELGDYIYGPNPPQDFRQQFTDPNTGQYDPQAAYRYVQEAKQKKNTPQGRILFEEYFPAIVKNLQRQKLETLLSNSYYVPKWLVEKTDAANNQVTSISYVRVPYGADTTIKVTDEDVKAYVNNNKAMFKQDEARGIEYVLFSGAPSAADSAATFKSLTDVKDSFARTANVNQFLLNENSQMPYYDGYIGRKNIKITQVDTIIKTPMGSAFGPYVDGSAYVMARVVDAKMIPDTAKARHILVATMQRTPQGQLVPVRDETSAKTLIDSIATAIRGGANFDTLVQKYSDDEGNKAAKGVYPDIYQGQMDAAFNDFVFTNPVGTKGVVKTAYGYHFVEVLGHRGGTSTGYKIAYLARTISPSDETDNNAQSRATQFAASSRSRKEFEENAKKQNLEIYNGADVKPLDANVNGVGLQGANARELVRWMYNDADKGEVSDKPFALEVKANNNNYSVYVVPVLTDVYEKGTMDVARARVTAEYTIRQQKKAKLVAEQIKNATTIEAVAQTLNQPVMRADSISFANPQAPNLGMEPKVIGAAFNKANQGKPSAPIAGLNGVYVIKSEAIGAAPNAGMDVKMSQQMGRAQMMYNARLYGENLKKVADIKDNRYKFF